MGRPKRLCGYRPAQKATPFLTAYHRTARNFRSPLRHGQPLSNSPNEHGERRPVAHDRNVTLARRGIFQPEHVTRSEPPHLTICRRDRKITSKDNEELNCGCRMIKSALQVMSTPPRIEPPEEHCRCRNVASDVQWRCGGSEVCRAEFTCHTLEVRVAIESAIKPKICNARRISGGLSGLSQLGHLPATGCRVFRHTGWRIPGLP